jgi:hypothetical protein
MYCPICGAEYRPTFTVCSDCQANLVPDPPSKPLEDAPAVDGPFVLVWSGTDPRRHAEVRELLERENIPEHTVRREDHLVNPTIHPAFEVYVPAVLKPRAKAALNEPNFGEVEEEQAAESGILEIPAEDDYQNEDDDHWDLADWHPEDATVEIWSGQGSDMADMITASLRENQIHYRTSSDETNPANEPEETAIERLFVLPDDEARGKEIVREIVNAAPPE